MRKYGVVFCIMTAVAMMVSGCSRTKAQTAKGAGKALKSIYFDFDKSNIKPEYEPVLQNNAQWLTKNAKVNVRIEGNCDERGSVEYNIALGDRRAKAAANYLKNLGISPNRISTVSYGEERPVCTEHNESCWWQNRRADFVTE